MQIDRDAVQRIIRLLGESSAGEIEVEDAESHILVRRPAVAVAAVRPPAEAPGLVAEAESLVEVEQTPAPEVHEPMEYVTAGLVGLFHHGRSPDAAPIISVGDEVIKGQVIGTIEALRKLTDVVSPADGVIAEVLVEDGEAVQFGDRLFAIRV